MLALFKNLITCTPLAGVTGAALILLISLTVADASWQADISSYQTGTSRPINAEKLEYNMSWNGAIHSGNLTIEFGKKNKHSPKVFLSHVYGRSTGLAYAMFPYTCTLSSFAQLIDHHPLVFIANERDNKKTVATQISYKHPGIHYRSTTTLHESKKIVHRSHPFSAIAIHDPLSAILAIRRQELTEGSCVQLCCHPFASPYLIKVTTLGREKHRGYDCIKLDIQIQKIDKLTGKLLAYKKLKQATMWLSDDEQRIPVELRSKVFVGDLRLCLTKRSPL